MLISLLGTLAQTLVQLKEKPAASAPDGRVHNVALAEALQIPQEQATEYIQITKIRGTQTLIPSTTHLSLLSLATCGAAVGKAVPQAPGVGC
jgi:hypothetical protein